MAGDWIKMESCLNRKPEVFGLASRLRMSRFEVVGRLHTLWVWADENTITGNGVSVTGCDIDAIVECPGFADALRQVGWLEGRDAALEFPNFDRHNGQTAKSRSLTAKRVAASRSRKCNVAGVTKTLPKEEKIREERQQKEDGKAPQPPLQSDVSIPGSLSISKLPPELDTPEFRKTWADWTAYRRQIKKPLRPMTAQRQLHDLARAGPVTAAAMIEQSITNGWQGLFEVKIFNRNNDNDNGNKNRDGNTDANNRRMPQAGDGKIAPAATDTAFVTGKPVEAF